MTVYVDPALPGDQLRAKLFGGDLIVLTQLQSVRDFVGYIRQELAELFAPHEPQSAHEHIEPDQMAKLLGAWKPRFIHAESSKKHVKAIIQEAGFPAGQTHYDLPKPRTSFPVGHLTTGVAFAFPWHRDVWYSAPAAQVNWWLPVFPVQENNSMSFDLPRFGQAVPNSSGEFDYYANNASRLTTATQVKQERQARPGAIGHQPDHDLVVLPAPGAVLLFSGAQLHTSIPNTSGRSRYSVDFRTVDVRDVQSGRGAPLVDVHCTGTSIRDFRNVADDSAFDEQMVVDVFGAPPEGAMLVFGDDQAEQAAKSV